MSCTSFPILKKKNRVATKSEKTDPDKNVDRGEKEEHVDPDSCVVRTVDEEAGKEHEELYRVDNVIHQRPDPITITDNLDDLLYMAVTNKHVKVAERLLDHRASIKPKNGKSLLHLALGYDNGKPRDKEEEVEICSCFERIKKYIKTTLSIDNAAAETKPETDNSFKCDEMAALLISKLSPCYVRFLFGDNTDFRLLMKKLTKNTRYPNGRTSQETLNNQEQASSSGKNQDTKSNHEFCRGSFNLMNIVKDNKMQKTTIAILDKLEDRDPEDNKVVYYKLLFDDNKSSLEAQDGTDKKEDVFRYIAKHRPDLIKHPVVRAVIQWKWEKKFHRRYLFDFILFVLSFIAITICAVVGAQSDNVQLYDSPWQHTRAVMEILMSLFILDSLRTEILQLYIDLKDYVKSILNWIEFASAVCLILSFGLRYGDLNAHWYLFAVGYIFWTVKGLKYCAVYRHADAYKETLKALMKRDLFLFSVFFIALEMLFGGTLLLVLRGMNASKAVSETNSILSIYYIGLRTMIDGQVPDNLDVQELPWLGQAVIIAFNIMTIVIMLNILVAQLTNTYEIAYAQGQIKSWVNRAEAIASYEKEDACRPFGGIRLLRNYCKDKDTDKEKGKIPFDKEKFLEEKEKADEVRAILKQVDSTLLHIDLSVQTVKTAALLQPRMADEIGQTVKEIGELKERQKEMKRQQYSILKSVKHMKNLLRRDKKQNTYLHDDTKYT